MVHALLRRNTSTSMIPITRREFQHAWSSAQAASIVQPRTNPHRLLLFYATECGLKAVFLKQQRTDVIDDNTKPKPNHNLNHLMTQVHLGKEYFLPTGLSISPIQQKDGTEVLRPCDAGTLNQVWRYGASLTNGADMQIETQLEKINLWIAKELT
jgi:hypothetical protein